MTIKAISLKARQALPATQAKIVTDLHRRIRKKIMSLLMILTDIERKTIKKNGDPLTQDEKQEIFDKWSKIRFLRDNMHHLERQWKELGVLGECPRYTEKERLTRSYAWIVNMMKSYGIDMTNFTTTHVFPVFDDPRSADEEEVEVSPIKVPEKPKEVVVEDPVREDPLDWSMSIVDDDDLGTVRRRLVGQKKLYDIRQSVRSSTLGLYDPDNKAVLPNQNVRIDPNFITPRTRRNSIPSTLPPSLFKESRFERDSNGAVIVATPSASRKTTTINKVMEAGDDTILNAISDAMKKMGKSVDTGDNGDKKDDGKKNDNNNKSTNNNNPTSPSSQRGGNSTPHGGPGGSGDPDDSDDPDDPRGGGGGGRGGRRPRRGNRGYVPPGLDIKVPQRGEPPTFKKFIREDYKDMEPFDGEYLDFMRFFHIFIEVVDQTDSNNTMKYQRLIGKLDPYSKHLIRNIHSAEYDRALSVLVEEYTDISKVIRHIYARASKVPLVRNVHDVEGIEKVVHGIQSILLLFEHYGLDIGYEAEILKLFAGKMPEKLSANYCMKSAHKPPSLTRYCRYLEAELVCAQTKRMLNPGSELQRNNANKECQHRGPFPKQNWKGKKSGKGGGGAVNAILSAEVQTTKSGSSPSTSKGSVNAAGPSTNANGKGKGFKPKSNSGSGSDDRPKPPCTKCKHPSHSMLYCSESTPAERKKLVRKLNLCFVCFHKGHGVQQCQANYKCLKCGGRHNVRLCDKPAINRDQRAPAPRQANFVGREFNPEDYNESLRVLYGGEANMVSNLKASKTPRRILLNFTIAGKELVGMLDTGATVNIIPTAMAEYLGVSMIDCNFEVDLPKDTLPIRKAIKEKVKIGKITLDVDFLVSDYRPVILISVDVFERFRLSANFRREVHQDVPGEPSPLLIYSPSEKEVNAALAIRDQTAALNRLVKENQSVFIENSTEVGLITSEQCHLHLTSQVPVTLRTYRSSPVGQINIDEHVKRLSDTKMIRKSTSPYSFPVVMVDKKDEGKKSRLCVDYRKLNEITISEHFPMPKIDDLKDLFLGAEWFTTIDIASGFYHIEMKAEDRCKTAFSTANGHYEWNRMPFGLKNAPIIFQRVISNLIQKHELNSFCLNYIDDIIVFSRSFDEHLYHLQKLFDMVKEENIKLKLSKCQFGKRSVVYLGFQIEKNSVSPLNSNTEAIEKAPAPTCQKDLRGFLGKVNYYHKFIPNRAQLLYPLYQLLRKDKEWKWDEDCEAAFAEVKQILTSSPVVKLFDPKHHTFLYTDASQKGLGAILKQADPEDSEETQYVVGYFSKSLLSYQQNYSATELELLAILSAIEYWHYYLVCHEFVVVTDHQPLKSVGKIGKPNTRLFNWAVRLKQYNFKVVYRAGDKNQEADYLSRNPIQMLEEVTSGMINWVDTAQIAKAQADCKEGLPKRVHTRETPGGGRRLVYVKKGLEKDYLPSPLALSVLLELHHARGHIGRKAMELEFTRKYYCPNLAKLLKDITKGCEACTRVKIQRPSYGLLGKIGPATAPYEIIHIDTKSGFKGLGSQKDNLHLAIDSFSRFVWGVSSKTKTSIDFINLISKIMASHRPGLIVADNYPAIRAYLFQNFLRKYGIEMMFVAANHPQTNGLIERANQSLVNRMRCKRIEQKGRAWSTQIIEVIDEYNHTIHSSTGYTPSYLLTGVDKDGLFADETLDQSRLQALENSEAAHRRNAEIIDRNKEMPKCEEGDEVFVQARHQLNRGMLEPRYEGPFKVLQKIGKSTVEVSKGGKPTRYHVSQLKFRGAPVTVPRVVHSIITTLACLALVAFTCESKSLETAGPILWRGTNHKAVIGYNFTTHVASMMSPCSPFDEAIKQNPIGEAIYSIHKKECEDAYEEQILKMLRKGCEVTNDVSALGYESHHLERRHRRQIGVSLFLLGGVISYGVMSLVHHFSPMVSNENLRIMNTQLKDQLNTIHDVNAKASEIQKGLLDQIKEQWTASKKIAENTTESLHAENLLAAVRETIDITEIHLGYLLDGFQVGQVTTDYRMLFRGSPLLNTTTPLRQWTAHSCQYAKERYFIMKFEIPVLAPGFVILKAVSFYIVTDGEKEEQCLTVFKGNQYVIWDRLFNCTRDLLWEPSRESDLVLVDPHHPTCVENGNRTTHWKKVQCGKKMFKRSLVQLKQDKEHFYVYCYKHELKVQGYDTIVCGNVVYKIPRTTTFYIDDISLKVTEGEYQSKFDISSRVNEMINQRTFSPDIGNGSTFDDLAQLIHEEEIEINRISWKKVVTNPNVYLPAGGVGIFLVLLVLTYCSVKCYKKYSPVSQFRQRTNQMWALQSLMEHSLRTEN